MSLLTLLCQKTVGFGQGFVDLSYQQISEHLKVGKRALSKAANILVELGVVYRKRPAGSVYRWWLVLDKDEVLQDPKRIYTVRPKQAKAEGGVVHDRSAPSCTIDHDPPARSIMTPSPKIEHPNPCQSELQAPPIEQKAEPLKKVIKETNTKKQHQAACSRLDGSGSSKTPPSDLDSPSSQSQAKQKPQLAPRSGDEPLHKKLLRELKKHGVNQRVARKLCRENDHALIQSVLEAVPQLSGIRNLPGYLVSAIQDGGYAQPPNSPPAGQKNGHQVSGGRSNYAHLTDPKINRTRHKSVKTEIDAPITYRSPEETKAEQEALEVQKQQQEQTYREKGQLLLERFKALSEDLQYRLKLAASVHLSKIIPSSGNREQMLKDQTFQRLANRTVLEQFFEWVDQGLGECQALGRLESTAIAA
jgi:hypothetical protein